MSHIEEVKTLLSDARVLEKALMKLFGKVEKDTTIGSRYVPTERVAYKLGAAYGLVKVGEEYTIRGDFYQSNTTKDKLLVQLNQTYSEIKVEDELLKQGFAITTRTKEKNGEIHITYTRRY